MVVTGLAAGLTGTALFIVIHSLLIFPIWTRFLGHVPLALAAGIGLAGAFEQAARLRGWRSVSDGARFGLVMFATLVPATAFSNVLRLAGIHANDWPGSVGSLALALGSGAAAGWIVTRRRAGILTFAAATLALTVAMAGPIPIVNGPRAAWLFAGFLPICIGAGIAVALARAMFRRQESS
jgi:hypothetical protein